MLASGDSPIELLVSNTICLIPYSDGLLEPDSVTQIKPHSTVTSVLKQKDTVSVEDFLGQNGLRYECLCFMVVKILCHVCSHPRKITIRPRQWLSQGPTQSSTAKLALNFKSYDIRPETSC